MASYAVVHDLQTDKARFAIVTDGAMAGYVFLPGSEMQGVNGSRVARLVKMRGRRGVPNTPGQWIALLMTNVGYFYAKPPVLAADLREAYTAALEALKAAG